MGLFRGPQGPLGSLQGPQGHRETIETDRNPSLVDPPLFGSDLGPFWAILGHFGPIWTLQGPSLFLPKKVFLLNQFSLKAWDGHF